MRKRLSRPVALCLRNGNVNIWAQKAVWGSKNVGER